MTIESEWDPVGILFVGMMKSNLEDARGQVEALHARICSLETAKDCVTYEMLSAEGERDEARAEVARLQAELAAMKETGREVTAWAQKSIEASEAAYAAGFLYGVEHPEETFRGAKELGIYPESQAMRDYWNHGRQDEATARRLGHNTKEMHQAGIFGPSLIDPAVVIGEVLDQRDQAWEDLANLRALAREVVSQMGSPDSLYSCDRNCGRVATLTSPEDTVDLCRECFAKEPCLGMEETSFAAAWMAFVKAVGK